MQLRLGALSAAFVALTSAAAAAATVSPRGSNVMVDTGGGFRPLTQTAAAPSGTRIMTGAGDIALITYSPTCTVRVGGQRVWTVFAEPPCTRSENLIDLVEARPQTSTNGVFGGPSFHTLPPESLVVGVLVTGGVVALAVTAGSGDKDSNPKSP
ncbi:MAG: hypothetical protein AB7U75_10385 [Hyphomicrobiaceae bacterium]